MEKAHSSTSGGYWGYFLNFSNWIQFMPLPSLENAESFMLTQEIPLHFAAIQVRNSVYLTGGTCEFPSSVLAKAVEFRFDELAKSLSVHQLCKMRCPRFKHCVVYSENYIYAMAGHGTNKKLRTCEKYSLIQDTWVPLPSLNYARLSASACALGHYVYISGGYMGNKAKTACVVERLDLGDEEAGWSPVQIWAGESLIRGRLGAGAFLMSPHDIQIFGGNTDLPESIGTRFDVIGGMVCSLHKKDYVPYDDKYRDISPLVHKRKVYVISDCMAKKCYWSLKHRWWIIVE